MTKTLSKIRESANDIYQKILKKKQPSMTFPLRALNNVKYDTKKGFFELLGKVKIRTLSVNTVKTFAQTLRMMAISKDLIATDDMATKREVYYVSKNWGDARFMEQPESDLVMDDIEAMFMVNREQLGFSADEHGGDVAGELIVIDKNPETKKVIKIDCTKFGSGAYSIPTSVEHLEFETDAKFILAIETKGMFERLNRHNYWKKAHCVIVSMGGVPSRACRRFIRKLADEKKLPVYVFTDGDPYGWSSIYRTLKVGSGNAAHINEFFCVPQARFLGVTAQDITDYKLPTHPLKDVDLKKIKDLFKNDPFIQNHKEWAKELKLLEQMGTRCEQQALAAHGLNFVIEKYLPQKLKHTEKFLP
ncbi:MAG: DNA topoisomerase IV subunit A [Nanoarchaeota archaeon]|nr:DNA topoisomerase IV subunit A [Nanoarchaeota archaeon]